MRSFLWPAEDGWPYPDTEDDVTPDPMAELDDDVLALHALPRRTFEALDPLEREVLDARFGLEGHEVRSMRELHRDLGLPRADLRDALGSGLAKLRTALTT